MSIILKSAETLGDPMSCLSTSLSHQMWHGKYMAIGEIYSKSTVWV